MIRTRSRISPWWRIAALAALLAPLAVAPAAALAQDAESTPEGEAPYYSDTQGPPQPGGVANFLLYEDPNTLNPLLELTSIAEQVTTAILEGLTYQRSRTATSSRCWPPSCRRWKTAASPRT